MGSPSGVEVSASYLIDSIRINYVDNELYFLLIDSAGHCSREVFHYVSGMGYQIDGGNGVIVNLSNVLPPGTYWLSMIGLNWGGPYEYKFDLMKNSAVVQSYDIKSQGADGGVDPITLVQAVQL